MLKIFPIDFIRQTFEQKLLEEHIKDVNLYGGRNQVNIFSFYEQLKSQEQVDRFVENYRDLADQQNRSGLILNGVLVSPENPTITNLYSSLIIPMSWTCSLRCTLGDRDNSIITINNLIDKLKGRKVDIAQLNCTDDSGKKYCEPFVVGTIGQNDGDPTLRDGDFIGNATNTTTLKNTFDRLIGRGLVIDKTKEYLLYAKLPNNSLGVVKAIYNGLGELLDVIDITNVVSQMVSNKLKVTCVADVSGTFGQPLDLSGIFADITVDTENYSDDYENVEGTVLEGIVDAQGHLSYRLEFLFEIVEHDEPIEDVYMHNNLKLHVSQFTYQVVENDGTYPDFIFPPSNQSFERYKISYSFDAIRCDEPRNLNAEEYCELTFSGSATIVNSSVQLGNDLLKIYVAKTGFQAETWESFEVDGVMPGAWLEPLEMPSGSNANTQINQLVSNNFLSNSHTDALALTLQYTFIYDKSNTLLKQWFEYARYGKQPDGSVVPYRNGITPNIIYDVWEIWSSWGEFESINVKTKIVENIDIENTESDTLTLSLTMQIQGENN